MYTSAEPCAMCAGAIYWAGIGRVVYGLSESAAEADHRQRTRKTRRWPCPAASSSRPASARSRWWGRFLRTKRPHSTPGCGIERSGIGSTYTPAMARPRSSSRPRPFRTLGNPIARARAGNRAHRKGLCRSGRARSADRDLREEGRPAQRRPRGRQGLGRSGLPRAAVQGRNAGDRASSAMPAARASTSSRWRIRRSGTTWSCARCAPVIRGRCSACRRSGTSRRPTARARSPIRAACSPISASRCRRTPKSACGIPPPRSAIW